MARPELPPKTPLAERLRLVRNKDGETPRLVFAKKIGLPVSTLASYEKGDSEPTASVLAKYRDLLGVSLVWLVSGEGEMFSSTNKIDQDEQPTNRLDAELMKWVVIQVSMWLKDQGLYLEPDDLWLTFITSYHLTLMEQQKGKALPDNIIDLGTVRDALKLAAR